MKQELLTELVHAPQDLDYVQHFQALASLHVEMQKDGPDAELLLRRAILEMAVGNFEAARQAAQDAATLRPDMVEAHYQRGLAAGLLACVKAEALPSGPSGHPMPSEPARALVEEAVQAFARATELSPSDEEVADTHAALQGILALDSEERVAARLRRIAA